MLAFSTKDLTCFVGTSESHLTHIPTLLIKSTEREESSKYRLWRWSCFWRIHSAIFSMNNSLCIFSGGTGSKAKNEIAAGKNISVCLCKYYKYSQGVSRDISWYLSSEFFGSSICNRNGSIIGLCWNWLETCIFSAKLLSGVSKGKCLCWFYFKLSKFFSKLQF